jgi:hypothetical protein
VNVCDSLLVPLTKYCNLFLNNVYYTVSRGRGLNFLTSIYLEMFLKFFIEQLCVDLIMILNELDFIRIHYFSLNKLNKF